MSNKAAPKIVPSAIKNPILRKDSPGFSQPIATKCGVCHSPIKPTTSAGMAMREPTMIPAPIVETDKPVAPRRSTKSEASPTP